MQMPEETSSQLKNRRAAKALAETKKLPPQTAVEVRRGVTVRRSKNEIAVLRLHYSCHPERNPEKNPEWKKTERKKYTSQADWDREQEIFDDAGGGELVFRETLDTYWDKIVITDPKWRPDPDWNMEAGFDHGRASPTAMLRCYADCEGTLYFCGEYYQPGMEIWEHAANLREMPDLRRLETCYADPSIFPLNAQANVPTRPGERAKSIYEIYEENGIDFLSPFHGDHSDVSFTARLLAHWANLEERKPTVRIVCRNYSGRPLYGMHPWDCPNLLWELSRTRRELLSAQQLLNRNTSEAIVQKDDHSRDACKYVLLSHPEPSRKPYANRVSERVDKLWKERTPTEAMLSLSKIQDEEREAEAPAMSYYGGNIRHVLAELQAQAWRGYR
jgi:hypothetical protein